jgi:hypothetical protein
MSPNAGGGGGGMRGLSQWEQLCKTRDMEPKYTLEILLHIYAQQYEFSRELFNVFASGMNELTTLYTGVQFHSSMLFMCLFKLLFRENDFP